MRGVRRDAQGMRRAEWFRHYIELDDEARVTWLSTYLLAGIVVA